MFIRGQLKGGKDKQQQKAHRNIVESVNGSHSTSSLKWQDRNGAAAVISTKQYSQKAVCIVEESRRLNPQG